MKLLKKKISLLLIIFLALGAIITVIYFSPEPKLSKAQKETIELFGYPNQFVVTYMPSGDEKSSTLVRSEVWYYIDQELQVMFMGGDIYNVEDLTIRDLTAGETYWHPITISGQSGPENLYFINLHLIDAGEQFIKVKVIIKDLTLK